MVIKFNYVKKGKKLEKYSQSRDNDEAGKEKKKVGKIFEEFPKESRELYFVGNIWTVVSEVTFSMREISSVFLLYVYNSTNRD